MDWPEEVEITDIGLDRINVVVACKIYPGMFDHEYLIAAGEADGEESSYFVHREQVQVEVPPEDDPPSRGYAAMMVADLDHRQDRALVRSHGKVFTGDTSVWVPFEKLYDQPEGVEFWCPLTQLEVAMTKA